MISISSRRKSNSHLGQFLEHSAEDYRHDYHSQSGRSKVVYTPLDTLGFSYEPAQGIDSYVGYIKNDSITFSFDFGWYTNDGIPSESELKYHLVRNRQGGLNLCDLGNISDQKILNNLEIVQVSSKDSLYAIPTIDVIYHDTYCLIDRVLWGSDLKYHEEYIFEELDTLGFHTKIYYPKAGTVHKKVGLFVSSELTVDPCAGCNQLGISSYEFEQNNCAIMLQYLRAARDAHLVDNGR
jgi:hypothetical protein